jgi:hypothetical protein
MRRFVLQTRGGVTEFGAKNLGRALRRTLEDIGMYLNIAEVNHIATTPTNQIVVTVTKQNDPYQNETLAVFSLYEVCDEPNHLELLYGDCNG